MCSSDLEYTGLLEGLRAAVEIDPEALVEARLDSKLVVEQMSGRWKIKHADMRALAITARDLLADITQAGGSVRFTWIPRAQNGDADALWRAPKTNVLSAWHMQGLKVPEETVLGPSLGRQRAHDVVYDICRQAIATKRPFLDLLAENPEIKPHMTREQLAPLVDPANYLGQCGEMTDRVLAGNAKLGI